LQICELPTGRGAGIAVPKSHPFTRRISVMLMIQVAPDRHPQSAVALRIPHPGLRFAGWE